MAKWTRDVSWLITWRIGMGYEFEFSVGGNICFKLISNLNLIKIKLSIN